MPTITNWQMRPGCAAASRVVASSAINEPHRCPMSAAFRMFRGSSCATLFLLGGADQMTPPKAAQSLIQKCAQAKVVQLPAGHSLMTEAPEGVLQALKDVLNP